MIREALFHDNSGVYAYPESKETLRLRLRTAAGDASDCIVFFADRYDFSPGAFESAPMLRYTCDGLFDYYSVPIRLKSKRFKYYFQVTGHQNEMLFLLMDRVAEQRPENTLQAGLFQFPYINQSDLPDCAAWAKDSVFYQIFVDRFCRAGGPGEMPGLAPWGRKPGRNSFFGGNIRGMESRLDYLANLGVSTVYMTPIFLSDTNHKYDAIDYYQIDPRFGAAEDMKRFVARAHGMGIRVVLDAVFNHMSNKSAYFQDVVKKGAASPYAGWFFVEEYPVRTSPKVNYETFGTNLAYMPRINTDNPDAAEHLIGAAEYWTRELDIDGWRLDVSDEVSHRFWKRFRARLKAIKPEVFIIGEVWYRATAWLAGDEYDSVMNYPFRQAVLDFTGQRIGAREFVIRIGRYLAGYREDTALHLLNLLGSHDTSRLLTMCGGDARKSRLALALLLTFPGIPMLYYGDELGMQGGEDPDCRGTMPWDALEANPGHRELCRKLIALRRENPALSHGNIRFVSSAASSGVLAYIRRAENHKALVAFNNSDDSVQFDLAGCGLGSFTAADDENGLRYDIQGAEPAGVVIGPFDYRIFNIE